MTLFRIVCALFSTSPIAAVASATLEVHHAARPRLAVLTDIGGDPDDQQSLIRLMLYANEFEIEALIATAVRKQHAPEGPTTRPHLIRQIVDAYGEVRPNLQRHASGWPELETLRTRILSGNPRYGRDHIGEGHDTEASRALIERVDAGSPERPLNVSIWGGQTDFAQALWRVRRDRDAAGFRDFQSRVCVFDIGDQDSLHDWLFAEFPDVAYVLSSAPPGVDKRLAAFRGMYLGGDESLTSLAWLEEHVRRNHGPLGALYPSKTSTAPNPHRALKEGDTPSWFFFLPTGLGDPAHPAWGGWGGRYVRERAGLFRDAKDTAADVTDARVGVWRWRPAFQNDFAARLDWCVTDGFKQANHPPVAVLNGDTSRQAVVLTAKPGGTLTLASTGSSDPDGNALETRWFIYPEAGSRPTRAKLSAGNGESIHLTVPRDHPAGSIHVILTLSDDGTPSLTRYRRAVIEVGP